MSVCRGAGSEPLRKERPQSNITCALCEFVMSIVQEELSENATEQEVIKVMEEICSKMPTTIRQECRELVDKWGPSIIDLINQKLDPQLVCRKINICPHDLRRSLRQTDNAAAHRNRN